MDGQLILSIFCRSRNAVHINSRMVLSVITVYAVLCTIKVIQEMLIIRGVIAKHLTFENFFSKKRKAVHWDCLEKEIQGRIYGGSRHCYNEGRKKTPCFSGIEYHLISEKIL